MTFNPIDHRNLPTVRVFRLVDEIVGLTLLEVSNLSEILMKILAIKEMPLMAALNPKATAMGDVAAKFSSPKRPGMSLGWTSTMPRRKSEVRAFTNLWC